MADIRINALATTATTPASDDYLALDGTAQGTRKILATNIANNVTDVILGTSGPSVKSTLSARAPRQGLVFDGTAGATVSVPALGTGDFTVAAIYNLSSVSGYQRIIGGTTNALYFGVKNTNPVVAIEGAAEHLTSTATLSAGKRYSVIYVRSSGTGTFYVDGIAAGSGADTKNYTTAETLIVSASEPAKTVLSPIIYNRAISASEVVALYEAGAPAGADYNSASNTAFNTSNFVEAIAYTTFTGVSATGFSATQTGAVTSLVVTKPNITINAGNRVLVTFTGTLTSGAVPNVALVTSANGVASNISAVAAGSNSVVLTATAPCVGVGFYTTGAATSYAISNVVATRQGLLLAPDAAQAGGGLVWYDTSGNAANITLPASGVSWNVPSSAKVATGWAFGGNVGINTTSPGTLLDAVGTSSTGLVRVTDYSNGDAGQFIARGSRGTPSAPTAQSASDSTGLLRMYGYDGSSFIENARIYAQTAGTIATNRVGGVLSFWTHPDSTSAIAEAMRITQGQNLLIGTTIDGGQKLQVSGTARVSGVTTVGGGSNDLLKFEADTAGNGGYLMGRNAADTDYTPLILIGNGLTLKYRDGANSSANALAIDSSANATFTGNVTVNGTGTQSFKGTIALKAAAVGDGITLRESYAGNSLLFSVLQNSGDGTGATIAGADGAGSTTFSVNTQTGAATFSGSIAIGNTVQTAAAVASTHKVTISIGGSTYYLLATNV